MVGNSLGSGLNRDALPQFCGPETLADVVQATSIAGHVNCHLSDQEFRRLLAEAYCASLKQDEGRYPRFRVFAGLEADAKYEPFLLVNFAEPPVLSSEEIRRLAPAFPSHFHVISVVASNGAMRLTGVLSFDYFHRNFLLDRPEFWLVGGRPAGVMIAVDGPGELRVGGFGVPQLRLRAGTIDELLPVVSTGAMRFCHKLGDAVRASIVNQGTTQTNSQFGGANNLGSCFVWIFQEILGFTSAMRHGGTFVILPTTGWQDQISFKYPIVDLDLARIVKEYSEAATKAFASKSMYDIRDRLGLQDKLLLQVRTLATIGATDGCVGISDSGAVVGFGGEILTSEHTASHSKLKFLNAISKEPWPDQTGEQLGGQRHRSAYRLCKTVPGTTAFVISQDGDLSVIYSDPDGVYAFRRIVPSIPDDL